MAYRFQSYTIMKVGIGKVYPTYISFGYKAWRRCNRWSQKSGCAADFNIRATVYEGDQEPEPAIEPNILELKKRLYFFF